MTMFSSRGKKSGLALAMTIFVGGSAMSTLPAKAGWEEMVAPIITNVLVPAASKGIDKWAGKDDNEQAESYGGTWMDPVAVGTTGTTETYSGVWTDESTGSNGVSYMTEMAEPEGVASVGVARMMQVDESTRTINLSPGSNTTGAIKDAFSYLANRSDKNSLWTLKFAGGTYDIDWMIPAENVQNVNIVSDPNNPATFKKSGKFTNSGGEYIWYFKYAKNVKISGATFIGQTPYTDGKHWNWVDQGLYFGSGNGITVDNNKFYNIGNAAVRAATHPSDPVPGVNSFNINITNNYFKNIQQISTTTTNNDTHGGSAHCVVSGNTFDELHGALKFASRTDGAKDVKFTNNTINRSYNHGIEINNYDDILIEGNKISNVQEIPINIYTNVGGVSNPYAWGDNITIKNNEIRNARIGIRFAPEKYSNGFTFVPKNFVVDNNIIDTMSQAGLSISLGHVDGKQVTNNKFSKISGNAYSLNGSTNMALSGNTLDGKALDAPGSGGGDPTPTPTPDPTPTPGPVTSKPSTPGSVSGSLSGTTVTLNWGDVSNESEYEVWIAAGGSTSYSFLGKSGADQTSYQHNVGSSPKAPTYTYKIRAKNDLGFSGFSGGAKVATVGGGTTDPTPDPTPTPDPGGTPTSKPSTPGGVAASQSGSTVKVSWQDTSGNEAGNEVWISTDGVNYKFVSRVEANTTSYTHSPGSGRYYYKVRSFNNVGFSGFSGGAHT